MEISAMDNLVFSNISQDESILNSVRKLKNDLPVIFLKNTQNEAFCIAHWMNALYECFALTALFPLVILLGAGGTVTGKKANTFCKFLGDISYPVYITYYPIVYVYMAWAVNGGHTLNEPQAIVYGLIAVAASITTAYIFMKFYDIPVRKWLGKKFIQSQK